MTEAIINLESTFKMTDEDQKRVPEELG